MVCEFIDREKISIKRALAENAHYVVFNHSELDYFADPKLHQELLDVGITNEMLREITDAMDSSCYYLPEEPNPVYHCGTLYPYYNITFTYPYFSGIYLKYYVDDVLKATEMMKTDRIYFSHQAAGCTDAIIEILFQKARDLDLYVFFLT